MEAVQGLDLDARCCLQEEQEGEAAQWLLEVSALNIKELEMLLMCNKSYCEDSAHSVSSKNTKAWMHILCLIKL